MHYSDRIIEALKARGWIHDKSGGNVLTKEVKISDAHVGKMGINSRVIPIEIDDNNRYFSVLSGFDCVFDIDGRDFEFKPKAGAKLLDDFAEQLYA